ncbi:MAG: VWA domain-containing protein [Bacteroidales bacterium]|nr:VWA domain-containing protein [Bacteroidales bacterium]
MKLKSITALSVSALALAGMVSCEDSTFIEGNALERVSYLYLNYCNPDTTGANQPYGNCPMIELDETNTSKDVIIDFGKTFTGKLQGTSSAEIIIDNVRFFDDYGTYRIVDISVDEQRDGYWVKQSQTQNPVTFGDLEELDIAIVIDNSRYLDKQYNNIISNAKSFVNTISRKVKNAKFTVVSTDTLNITPLGSADAAISAIGSMQNSQYGYLSSFKHAMDELVKGESSSQVMVYFGSGSFSEVAKVNVAELLKTDEKYCKIQSFALAYSDDGVLPSDMKGYVSSLCVRGYALYPTEGDKLGEFFDYFSNSLASAYNIKYSHEATRYDIDNKQSIRFKFVLTQQR